MPLGHVAFANDLEATPGAGISWNEITLEITNERITKGIELKLPWTPAYRGRCWTVINFSISEPERRSSTL